MRADSIARLHRSEATAVLLAAQAAAVGGPTWAVRRASSGDGLATAIIPAERTALISGWVYQYHPRAIVIDGALFQPNDEWRLVAVSGTDVQAADELVSASDLMTRIYDTAFSFTVLSVDEHAGYLVAILEEVA